MNIQTKLKCHLWEITPQGSDLFPLTNHFDFISTLEEDNHISRYILKCKVCGQIYFYEFYEVIDWKEGNDPQYTTFIPVRSIDEAEQLNYKTQFELLGVTPRLQDDFLQDGTKTIRWVK